MLHVKHLSKFFKNHKGIDDLSFEVEPSDIFGIIGQSGAGKSTLIRTLSFLEEPTCGEIILDHTPLCKKNILKERRNIGMIFQHFNLFASRTVSENVAYPLEIAGALNIASKVQEMLSLVNLQNKAHLYPKALSGGEKQRVGIARALITHPKILFCDEATSALDPRNTEQILTLLKHLNKTLNLTILLITHEMDVIKALCNKVAVLDRGKIVEMATTATLFANPKHPATISLLEHRAHTLPAATFTYPVFRLTFSGPNASKPIISEMIRKFNVNANILMGTLDYIQNTVIGSLTVELQGEKEEISKALAYLQTEHVSFLEIQTC